MEAGTSEGPEGYHCATKHHRPGQRLAPLLSHLLSIHAWHQGGLGVPGGGEGGDCAGDHKWGQDSVRVWEWGLIRSKSHNWH